LDELGAVLDHKEAHASGGPDTEENLVTSCAKCNGRKGNKTQRDWDLREKRKAIKAKYGEPENWDGLSNLFVLLAERNLASLTAGEREWLRIFKQPHFTGAAQSEMKGAREMGPNPPKGTQEDWRPKNKSAKKK
jgi:hypothetical protein